MDRPTRLNHDANIGIAKVSDVIINCDSIT